MQIPKRTNHFLGGDQMTHNDVGEVRRSAALMTFGPGSIVDMRASSAPISGVHCGLEDWDEEAPLTGAL
jgi:hypothetical protein